MAEGCAARNAVYPNALGALSTVVLMSTGFEIWDGTTHNSLEFDQLEEAIVALRGLVERNGSDAVEGLSLDAVNEDGTTRITLAEDDGLLGLIAATAAAR